MRAFAVSQDELFEAVVSGVITEGYAVVDGFLSQEEAKGALDAASQLFQAGRFKEAGIGKGQHYQVNQHIRRDSIHWVSHRTPPEGCKPFFTRLQALADYFNQSCYLGIRDMEIHFAVYPEGSFYKRHLDVFHRTLSRKLSVVCYLNFNWAAEDGGQLRLFLADESGTETYKDIDPLAGRLVCFNSQTLEHEVLPARRPRYSLTGWLKDEMNLI